jgi:transcriptional regulator with XRE-family HTH domain
MKIRNVIGRQVGKLRDNLKWSQDYLAERLQLAGWHDATRSTVSKIENRSLRVHDYQHCLLASVLGVPRDALYPEPVDKLVEEVISQSNNEHRFVSGLFDRTQLAATRNP